MTIAASVVVPTCRRNEMLRRCLDALVRQDCRASYEIVVADDAGDPETHRFIDGYASRQARSIRYITVGPRHGPAAARNAGWRAARGTIIAFTDDDCVPAASWLENGLRALGDAAAAAGHVVVPLPSVPTDYERDCAGLSQSEFVTANCFCRRDVLERIGGFDEDFTIAWREDSDLQFTLLEQGYRIAAAPQAVVVHPVRRASWGVSLMQQRKTRFNALLFKKHRRLYRQRISASPGRYYAISILLAGMAVGVGTGTPLVSFVSAAGWAALTGSFCARRLRGTSHSMYHVAEMILTSMLIPPLSLYWRLRGAMQYRVLYF